MKRVLVSISLASVLLAAVQPARGQTLGGSNQSMQLTLTNGAAAVMALPNCPSSVGTPLILKITNTGPAPLRYCWTPTNGVWDLLAAGASEAWGPVGVPDSPVWTQAATGTNTSAIFKRVLKQK